MDPKIIGIIQSKFKKINPSSLTIYKLNKLFENGEREFFSSKVFIDFLEHGLHQSGPLMDFLDHKFTKWLLKQDPSEIDFIKASKNAKYYQFRDILKNKNIKEANVLELTG